MCINIQNINSKYIKECSDLIESVCGLHTSLKYIRNYVTKILRTQHIFRINFNNLRGNFYNFVSHIFVKLNL